MNSPSRSKWHSAHAVAFARFGVMCGVMYSAMLLAGGVQQFPAMPGKSTAEGKPEIKREAKHDAKREAKRDAPSPPPPADSLETYIGTIRRLQAKAPAASRSHALALEAQVPELRDLFAELEAHPSAATHRQIADQYVRRGVRDAAYDHYVQALALDPRD